MPAPPLAGRPDAQGTLCHHGPACGGPPSIEQRLPEEGGGAGTRSDMPFERTRQRRLHAASFPSRATVIADSSCRAVPGRWTLEPGAPLGWTPTRGVGGVSPQRPLLLGSQHPWNLPWRTAEWRTNLFSPQQHGPWPLVSGPLAGPQSSWGRPRGRAPAGQGAAGQGHTRCLHGAALSPTWRPVWGAAVWGAEQEEAGLLRPLPAGGHPS